MLPPSHRLPRRSTRVALAKATTRSANPCRGAWRRLLAAVALGGLSFAGGGCARRAYTDVYIENMAAEIRDLEDQLYEFDGEYHLMEQELAALKAENDRLKSTVGTIGRGSNGGSASQRPSPLSGSASDNFVPRSDPSGSANKGPTVAPSLERMPGTPGIVQPAPLPSNPQPLDPSTGQGAPETGEAGRAKMLPAPSIKTSPLPTPAPVPGSEKAEPLDLKDLAPPSIETGEAMPPILPAPKRDPSNPVSLQSNNDLEIELGRIPLPARLASSGHARSGSHDAADLDAPNGQVAAAVMPADKSIVDIKFHPTLCRSVHSHGQADDDGLYLVLQPLNQAGEFVPLAADLMVLALDLSRDEKQATIGRWTFSAADVKAKLQPIGSSQGIHLSLPLSGPAPQCDRLLVFAYYTLADGRRVVAEHEVPLNNFHRQSAAWVPRSQRGATAPGGAARFPVQTASGQR